MSSHHRDRQLVIAAMLVLGAVACPTRGAEQIPVSDRQALREFRLNRLFAMLGYLEQRASNVGFAWNQVGYGEAGNAWSGVSEEGEDLAPSVRELVRQHEEKHRSNILQEFGRTAAGSLEGEGVKALAKIELKHALEDLQRIDALLAGWPQPTAEELDRLRKHEADLLRRFKPLIPGLEAVAGGFTAGGSYKSQAYPDPDATIYLSEYVKVSPTSAAADGGSAHAAAQAHQAALGDARESLERIRALVGYFVASRQRYAEQLEKAREPLKRGQAARTVLDKAVEQLKGLQETEEKLLQELELLEAGTARLEADYPRLAEITAERERQAATICDYARRAKDTPAKQVRAWKAEANLTVHQMASDLEALQELIDQRKAEAKQRCDAVVALVRELNLYDAMTLALPLIPELRQAQAQAGAAFQEADATALDMGTAVAQIKQEQQRIEARLQPYAGDQQTDVIRSELARLMAGVVHPAAELAQVRQQALGSSGEPALLSASHSRYDLLEEKLRTLDVNKSVVRAQEAIQEAEAVRTVLEAKTAPAYQALQRALECFAKIDGGTAETPAPLAPPSTPVASSPAVKTSRQTVWVLKETVSNPANLQLSYHPWPHQTLTLSLSGSQGSLHVVSVDPRSGETEYDWEFQYKYSPPPQVLRAGEKFDVRVEATAGGAKQDYVVFATHEFNTSGIKYEYRGKLERTNVGRFDVGRAVVANSDGVFHCQVEEAPAGDSLWLEMGIFAGGARPFVRHVYEKREVGAEELQRLTAGQ